ncbi:hypothetical protein ACWV27_25610 (plasmid) [Massilia varians]
MTNATNPPAHFIIAVDAAGPDLDTSTMRSGFEKAVEIGRNEGMLTPIDDKTTLIKSIAVIHAASPADAVWQLLAPSLTDSLEAHQAVHLAVSTMLRQHARERVSFLSEEERQYLINGMVGARQSWEKSGDDAWIADVVHYGYDGYAAEPDVGLIEAALCDNPIFAHLADAAERLAVLRVLATPEVVDMVCSVDRANPVRDFDEYDRKIWDAVAPFTVQGAKIPPEQVAEAMQLYDEIHSLFTARLQIDDAPEDQAGDDAPRA